MDIRYYDIGLNLFCPQFKHPDTILHRAEEQGVACILTGSDPRENRRIHAYLTEHPEITAYGTAGLHPHNADDFTDRLFKIVSHRTHRVDYEIMTVRLSKLSDTTNYVDYLMDAEIALVDLPVDHILHRHEAVEPVRLSCAVHDHAGKFRRG